MALYAMKLLVYGLRKDIGDRRVLLETSSSALDLIRAMGMKNILVKPELARMGIMGICVNRVSLTGHELRKTRASRVQKR